MQSGSAQADEVSRRAGLVVMATSAGNLLSSIGNLRTNATMIAVGAPRAARGRTVGRGVTVAKVVASQVQAGAR